MKKLLLALFVAAASPAYSVSIDGAACVALRYDKPRLACFDKASKDVIEGKATASSAAGSFDSSSCIVLFDDAERLICFDKASDQASSAKGKAAGNVKQDTQPSVTNTEIDSKREASLAELAVEELKKQRAEKEEAERRRQAKIIDPRDVRNTPRKWQDRVLQFNRVNVYWVEDSDVRILMPSGDMTVFATKVIGPSEAIEYFRRECETSKEAFSAKCRAAVRFSYFKHAEDKPNGYSTRTVLITRDLEFVRLQQNRKR